MDPKNIVLYKGGQSYFIADQYQKDNNFECKNSIFDCKDAIFDCKDTNFCSKDTIFEYEDAYHHYDIDVDRILLFKQSNNKYFIRYTHSNKMDTVPLQIKMKNFYYEIQDYNNGDNVIYIENTDEGFFETMREIWNKITELLNINNVEDFIQYILDDNSKYIEADVLENTSFVENKYLKDKIITVLDSVVNDILNASLLELREFEY